MDVAHQVELLDQLLLAGVRTEFPDTLTDREKVAVNAYLVLSHACIEEYAERVFLAHYDRLEELATLNFFPPSVAQLALAVGWHLPDAMKQTLGYKSRTLAGAIQAGRVNYLRSYVGGNDGLKENNIKKLAQGLGVEWPRVESRLSKELIDLNTLGAKRGAAGHLSPFTPSQGAHEETYPSDVRAWVESGRDAVLALERLLTEDATVRALTDTYIP